jgi:hypothetical protein
MNRTCVTQDRPWWSHQTPLAMDDDGLLVSLVPTRVASRARCNDPSTITPSIEEKYNVILTPKAYVSCRDELQRVR